VNRREPDRQERPLELSPEEFAQLVGEAVERIRAHVGTLPEQPAADTEGAADLARSLREELPEDPSPFPELLDLLFERAIPKSFNTAGPGYFAYIPGGGLLHSAIADLIADSVNRYVGVWAAAPGLAQIEANVLAWFSRIVGYPSSARGFLTSGGSLANFSAIFCARRERLPEDFHGGVIYTSEQAHHSVRKAARLAGFPEGAVVEVPTDGRFRIRTDGLEEAIHRDRAGGRTPFLLVGNAGTTNTGAVDDLRALADLARSHGLWFHVDAAYGGFFLLTGEGRRRMAGIELADSVVLDPHKGLFLPYGTGSLLVRDGAALLRAHSQTAAYMPPMQEASEFVDFCQISPELSRDWRGLRVWLPVRMLGIGAFRRALEEKLELARRAAEELRGIEGIEVVAEPQLSIVAFRLVRPGLADEEINRLNREVLDRVNARRRVYLTATDLGGRFVIRICVLSFRSHLDRLTQALEDIRSVVKSLY
jgi:aromatic-L-amino-acid decarboxylase